MTHYQVTTEIHLTTYQVLNYYRGVERHVEIHYSNAKTISLPYSALLPFVGHEGIHGTFVLKLENSGELEDGTEIVKLIDITKLDDPAKPENTLKKE